MYAIKYFRDAAIVRWYEEHGIHDRPVGYVIGKARYHKQWDVQHCADHINRLGPSMPVTVIPAYGV